MENFYLFWVMVDRKTDVTQFTKSIKEMRDFIRPVLLITTEKSGNKKMWCIRCGQDVPWTASAKDGRLACSRCGTAQEREAESQGSTPLGHIPLNVPINSVHSAHPSSASTHSSIADAPIQDPHLQDAPFQDASLGSSDWPVASAYDGWNLDEQLSNIRETLDLLSSSAPVTDTPSTPIAEPSKTEYRFDAMHPEKRGLHRRAKKEDRSLMGRFVFGLVSLMLGTGILVLSIASILPRQLWFEADVPIAGVLLQVFGVFLIGLGLSAQLRRFHAALRASEASKPYRRFDEPQMDHASPHLDAKVRS